MYLNILAYFSYHKHRLLTQHSYMLSVYNQAGTGNITITNHMSTVNKFILNETFEFLELIVCKFQYESLHLQFAPPLIGIWLVVHW